jgi:hypothetical protein
MAGLVSHPKECGLEIDEIDEEQSKTELLLQITIE